MKITQRGYLKYLGYLEGTSLIVLLLIAMPLKYFAELPFFSKFVGTLHGCLFLMYIVTLFTTGKKVGLTGKQIWLGFFLSCLPFGPFIFEYFSEPTAS